MSLVGGGSPFRFNELFSNVKSNLTKAKIALTGKSGNKLDIKSKLEFANKLQTEFKPTDHARFNNINSAQMSLKDKIENLKSLKNDIEVELNAIKSGQDILKTKGSEKKLHKGTENKIEIIRQKLYSTEASRTQEKDKVEEGLAFYTKALAIYTKIDNRVNKFESSSDYNFIIDLIKLKNETKDETQQKLINASIKVLVDQFHNELKDSLSTNNFEKASKLITNLVNSYSDQNQSLDDNYNQIHAEYTQAIQDNIDQGNFDKVGKMLISLKSEANSTPSLMLYDNNYTTFNQALSKKNEQARDEVSKAFISGDRERINNALNQLDKINSSLESLSNHIDSLKDPKWNLLLKNINIQIRLNNPHLAFKKISNEKNCLGKLNKLFELADNVRKNINLVPEQKEIILKDTVNSQKQLIEKQFPEYKNILPNDAAKYLEPFREGAYFISNGSNPNQFSIHYNTKEGSQTLTFAENKNGQLIYNDNNQTIEASTVKEFIQKLQSQNVLPKQMTSCATYEAAQAKIAAAWRGKKTRDVVVLPNQIIPLMKDQLLSDGYTMADVKDISRAICRELNEMSTNPAKYKGKSVRVPLGQIYQVPVFTNDTGELKAKHNCWLEMSPDGKEIKLLMSEIEFKSKLREGGFKIVHKAHSFEIPFHLEQGERKGTYDPYVLYVAQPNSQTFKNKEEEIKVGLYIQGEMLKEPGIYIVELPQERTESADPSEPRPFELKIRWYNSDLLDAVENGSVPLGFDKNAPTQAFTLENSLEVVSNVARAAESMHAKGYVHRDLKTQNILVKDNHGYLNDFDLATQIGFSDKFWDYDYFDPLGRTGCFTPSVDVFDLALALGASIYSPYDFVPTDLNGNPKLSEQFDFVIHNEKKNKALSQLEKKWISKADKSKREELSRLVKLTNQYTQKYSQAVENMVKNDPIASPETKQTFLQYYKQRVAVEESFDLVWKTLESTQNLDNFMKQRPDIKKIFDTGTLEEKQEIWKYINDSGIFPSTTQFCEELEAIKQRLKS